MKHLKILLPLIAVVFAVAGVWAMSSKHISGKNADPQTWYYTGPSAQTSAQLNDPSNYSTSNPGSDCESMGSAICSIVDVAASGGTKPALSHGTVSLTNTNYDPGFRR